MDTIVFDIETQNFFSDPGVGWNNYAALKISVIGLYSYAEDKYLAFEEGELLAASEYFARADCLVGFSSNRYDIPVLNLYFRRIRNSPELDLWQKKRVDLLEEIEVSTGNRISLSRLAEANLGVAKDHHGSDAIKMFEAGQMEELKKYCLKDVVLTKELYDKFLQEGSLWVPDKESGETKIVHFRTSHAKKPTTLF